MHPYAWSLHAEAVVLVPLLGLGYAFVLRRYPAPGWRIACFLGGLGLTLVVFVTPLERLALHYLLTAHLLQNVALAEWSPALVVLGLPPAAAAVARKSAAVRMLTHPLVALPLWLASYYAWHVPAVYDAALRHQSTLIHVEHACYFGTGVLAWWPVVQSSPRRLPSGFRAAYAFAAFVLASPVGLLLALLPRPVYDFYVDVPTRVWGLSPLTDQQIGGVTMASEQALVLFIVFLFWFRRFLAEEGAT